MCDICIPILRKYAKPHPGRPCSLAKSLYCARCACNGHSAARCKRRVETGDVIAADAVVEVSTQAANIVEVVNKDGPVRAMLMVNGVTPMVCQEKGKKLQRDLIENRRRLLEVAKGVGKTLVLVDVVGA